MKSKIYLLGIWMVMLILISGCTTNQAKSENADQALGEYFDLLVSGDYEAAAGVYGGSYESLVMYNPDIDPDDHASLLRNACEVNGFQCLPVRTRTFNEVTSGGEYIFTVEFSNPDDSLFVLGACCGENPTTAPQFQFEYRVVEGGDGQFRVLDLPVYIP